MADLRILYVEQDDDLGIGVDVRVWSEAHVESGCRFFDYVLAWRKGRETHKQVLAPDVYTDAQAIRAGIAKYDELAGGVASAATEALSG
jgi:glutamate dehydrogenase/leucine dehydrogenase